MKSLGIPLEGPQFVILAAVDTVAYYGLQYGRFSRTSENESRNSHRFVQGQPLVA